jgi:serine/threonine protein kinase
MHPHIAHIYDLLHDDENFYIVQEIVRTGDLFKFLDLRNRTKGRLTESEVRTLSKQLFSALDYMHK